MSAASTRRSLTLTAVVAVMASIASPFIGNAFAATAMAVSTFTPADGSTVTANRPAVSAQFNQAVDQSATTINVVDTSASNSAIACTPSFPAPDTIACALQQDLIDNHVYKVSTHGVAASDSANKVDASASWTIDIPSLVTQSPKNGATVGSGSTPITATYDEAIDTAKSSVTVTNSAGNSAPGTTKFSASGGLPTSATDTITFTPSLPDGTYNVHIHVEASGNPAAFADTVFSYVVNGTLPPSAPTVTTAGYTQDNGATHWINSVNQAAVPFAGTAPNGFSVGVVVYDKSVTTPTCSNATGSCPNDAIATTSVKDCGQTTCPWSLTLDDSSAPDKTTYQYYVYSFSGAGKVPAAPNTANNPVIGKDTAAPGPPNNSSATLGTGANANMLTVTSSNPDTSVTAYGVVVTDAAAQTITKDPVPATTTHNAPPPIGVGNTQDLNVTFDVSTLEDGNSSSTPAPSLPVTVYSLDLAGNPSQPDPLGTSFDKETRTLTPDYANSFVTAGGQNTLFPTANNSSVRVPTSITIKFNELLRPTAVNGSSTVFATGFCVADKTGLCLGGTQTFTKDNRGIVFTFGSVHPSDTGSPYTVRKVVAVSATCPDKSATAVNCEHYLSSTGGSDPGTVLTFSIDTTPPTAPTVTVTPSPTIDGATDATGKPHAANVSFVGTAEPGSAVTVKVKSAGGGALLIANPSGTPVAADSSGNWSLLGVNLTSLPDGVLTVTAVATDAAGNASPAASPVTSPTLAARPTPPQSLSASVDTTSVTLRWVAPAGNGGTALTGYTLTYTDKTAGGQPQTANPSASPYTVVGLVTGHTYVFALCGTNGVAGPCNTATVTATPRNATAVSALISHSTISYGTSVTLSGRLTRKDVGAGLASQPLTITPRFDNGSHGSAIHTTTNSTGNWSVSLKPVHDALYSVVFAGDSMDAPATGSVRSFVRAAVKITKISARSSSHSSPVTISGSVSPGESGRLVYVYEHTSRGNKLVGRAKLTSRSTFALVHTFVRGTHTVFAKFLGQNGNATGTSRSVRFSRT